MSRLWTRCQDVACGLQAVCLVHPGSKELAGRAGLVEVCASPFVDVHILFRIWPWLWMLEASDTI